MTLITKRLYAGAAAGAALLSGVALVSAQQTPDKGNQPSVREPSTRDKTPDGKAPEGKAMREAPGTQQQPGGNAPRGAQGPDKDQPKGAERPDKDRAKGAQGPDKDRPKGAERPDKDQPKAADRPDKDQPKGAERPDKGQPKAVERPDKDRPKGAEGPNKDRPKGAERPDATKPSTAQPDLDKTSPGRARVSEQQRSEVGTKLRGSKVERTRVQIDVNIGARVPRSVRLHPLPSAILVSAPAYRGYSYLVREDDTIVIVDRSYVVVDVIPVGPTTRTAGLSLSREQMHLIYTTVPKDQMADVRTRLALGAEVPANVELLPFPAEIEMQVPELQGYRYVVAGGDVVIVDPKDRDIALVITE